MKGESRRSISSSQSGNVLFLILIAVALFAALSYVVTQSTRTGGSDSTEKDQLIVSELLNAISSYNVAIERMSAAGVGLSNISFENNSWKKANGSLVFPVASNSNCTSDRCKLFVPSGGGAIPYTISRAYFKSDPINTLDLGSSDIQMIRVVGIGTDAADMVIHYDSLPLRLCVALNKYLKIGAIGDIPVDDPGGAASFDGTLDPALAVIGDDAAILEKKSIFAYKVTSGANVCRIAAVLVAR